MSIPRPSAHTPPERLESWKEIASHLNRDVRTVQRWEHVKGLPVRRLPGGDKSRVYALRSELDAWWSSRGVHLVDESDTAAPATKADVHDRTRILILTIAAACGLLLVAGTLLRSLFVPGQPVLASPPVALTGAAGAEIGPSFSPDGTQVAYSWSGPADDNFDVYVKLVGPGPPLRLTTHPRQDISPSWSPDGTRIAFLRLAGREADVVIIPALGGAEQVVARVRPGAVLGVQVMPGPYLTWTPASEALIVTDQEAPGLPHALFRLSLAGGEKQRLTTPAKGEPGDCGPAISPDGRWLAFSRSTGPFAAAIRLLRLDSRLSPAGAPIRLRAANPFEFSPAWSPGGQHLIFASKGPGDFQLYRVGLRQSDSPELLHFGEGAFSVAVSPRAGRALYGRSTSVQNIYRVETGTPTRPALQLLPGSAVDMFPDLSPDGSRLAFSSNRSGRPEIWTAAADGSSPLQVTSLGAHSGAPRWSPDGSRVVFFSTTEGREQIFLLPVPGGRPVQITTSRDGANRWPGWSADGSHIYFASNRGGSDQIWKMPATGGSAVQITQRGGSAFVAESPEGKWIYYSSGAGTSSTLRRIPFGGGDEMDLPVQIAFGAVASCREGLYFSRPNQKAIWFYPFSGGPPEQRLVLDKRPGPGLTATPDCRSILVPLTERETMNLMLVETFR